MFCMRAICKYIRTVDIRTYGCVRYVHRFLVHVSYLEIYNEEVRDLLGKDPSAKLEVCTYTHMYILTIVCIFGSCRQT